ncbi:MAG: polysaccharide deacetylase family protein [Bacteroidota bacterium]|jgi:peptidoglycan/xylan/chitin deacetylase (PgdA/CDA1 family)
MPTIYRRLIHGLIAAITASFFFVLATLPTEERAEGNRELKPVLSAAVDSLRADSLSNLRPPGSTMSAIPQPVVPVVILHGPRDLKMVALTFDACSTIQPSRYDERITNILIETGTRATLFLGGKWMEEEPEHTKELAAHPQFELANHTFSHPHLSQTPDDGIRRELLRTQEIMDSLTGRRATLFRPPYGDYNDRVVHIAAEVGLKTVQFDLASGDPDPTFTKERLVTYVTSMAKNGSIIVMHINGRGWHTAEALPAIIARLRDRGFTFVTVGEMLALPSTEADKKKRARE